MAHRGPTSVHAPLIGRDAELDRIERALDGVIGGDGRVLLLSGEPGIGKTRLAEELAATGADRGAVVAWGRVDDLDGAPPYWPWMQLLEGVLEGVDRDVVSAALHVSAGPIATILPSVSAFATATAPPPGLDPVAARFRLHQAIVDFLRRVGASQPLVLILDDLHWADTSSLQLTRFVAQNLTAVPVLLSLTYRTIDAGSSEALADVLGALARHPALERIALEGLSEPEVGQFMAQSIGLRPRRVAVASVHARTEGNPFFVGELARLLHSEGLLATARIPDRDAVPVGVREVVRRRLVALPQHTNELLALGAVVGREFDIGLLAACVHLSDRAVADAVEPGLAAGLVSETGTATGRVRFSHALVRDTIYRELSALRRATLHGRIGEALEQRYEPDRSQPSELALHFFHAAPVVGPERGLAYALAAAKSAESALAFERAQDEVRRALALVELLPERAERIEQELHVQNRLAALLLMTRGQADPEVGRACARARELSHEVGESDELIATLSGLANFHFVRSEYHIVDELAGQLLTIGEQRSSTLALALGHLCKGGVQPYVDELGEARSSFASAVMFARRLELTTRMAEDFRQHPLPLALGYVARCAWLAGDELDALAASEESLLVARRLDHPYTLAFAFFLRAQLAVLRDAPDAAAMLGDEAIQFCSSRAFLMLESWIRVFHGWAISELGSPDAGIEEMAAGLGAHRATGARVNTSLFLALLADGEHRRGDGERAIALIDEALSASSGDRIYEADLHRRRGELLAIYDEDRVVEAEQALRTAIRVAEVQGAVTLKRRAMAALARLAPATATAAQAGAVPAGSGQGSNLSPRELELLGLVGRGLTDKAIAAQLVISLTTVRSHLDRIRDKTGRRRRAELTRLAIELGLTSD